MNHKIANASFFAALMVVAIHTSGREPSATDMGRRLVSAARCSLRLRCGGSAPRWRRSPSGEGRRDARTEDKGQKTKEKGGVGDTPLSFVSRRLS